MTGLLANPGDSLDGAGLLLQQGRIVADVYYHLSVPTQTHFLVNPLGGLKNDYANYAGGFVLVPSTDAIKVTLGEYVLELADKSKRIIRVERRYKTLQHQGRNCLSFWVAVLPR